MANEFSPDQIEMIKVLSTRNDLTPDQQQMVSVLMSRIEPASEETGEPIPAPLMPPPPGAQAAQPEAPRVREVPKPWATSADQPLTTEPFKEIGRYAVGGLETALSGVSQGAGMVAGGLAGLARLATFQGPDKAAEEIQKVQEKPIFSYEPKTEAGKVVAPFVERATTAPTEPIYEAYEKGTGAIATGVGKVAGPTAGGLAKAALSVAPIIGGAMLGKRLARRAAKKQYLTDAGATPEFKEALKRHGMTESDIGTEGKKMLEQYNFETPDQAVRAAFMKDQGLDPTRAQVTRSKSEMMAQQEFAKTTNKVSGRLADQNAQLKDKFDLAAMSEPQKIGTLKLKETSGTPAYDRILDRVTATDNEVFQTYQQAAKKSGGRQVIAPKRFEKALDDYMSDDDLAGGLVSAIRGVAKKNGFFDPDTGKFTRAISADEAEKMIQSINKRYKKTGDANKNRIGRLLKDELDLDVAEYGGPEIYKKARLMKARLHRDLRPEKTSKWAKRDVSLTEDILNETVAPEEVLTKGIFSPKYRAKEINHLKKFLHSGTPDQKINGKKAWKELKAEAFEWLRDNSFSDPLDQRGNKTITRARFENAVRKFGNQDKLKAFFDPQEIKFLEDMQKTLEIIEPTPGTYLGQGPTAAAINARLSNMAERARKFETFKKFEGAFFDPKEKALKLPAESLKRFEKASALGAGLAVSPEDEE